MDFQDSGLPQHPLIEKGFHRLYQIMRRDYKDPDHAMQQIVSRGIALRDGFRDDTPPVRLICAAFLAFIKRDSLEYDLIRDDYNLEIYQTVKRIDTFPDLDGSNEFTGALLSDPHVHGDIKVSYLANALSAIRILNQFVARLDPSVHIGDDITGQYEGAIAIGVGCAGTNAVLDYLLVKR